MRNRALQRAVILTCVLLICFMTNYVMSSENPLKTNDEYLSVRESLIPMFARGGFSQTYVDEEFPFKRLNPKAKEYIRFYLEEDNIDQVRSSVAIWLLGFIGDANDILFIEQYIDKTLISSRNFEHRVGYLRDLGSCAGCFGGMMFKRNIMGAESFLKKYAKVSSWIVPGEEETSESLSDARDFYSRFILFAYQYSKMTYIATLLQEKSNDAKPYIHESIVDSYLALKVDQYTELMKPVSIPEKKLNENMAKCLEQHGEWIDRLLKKQTYVDWRKEQDEQKVVSNTGIKTSEDFEIVDMSKTVEGEIIKAIAINAVKGYIGIPVSKIEENLLINNEILQEIKVAGFKNFDNFKVKAEVEAKIEDFVPSLTENEGNNEAISSEPNVTMDKIDISVTFDISKSAERLEKYGPDAVHKSIISPNTGNLIVNMKRINDGWRWAPFTNSPINTDSNIVDDEYIIDSVYQAMIAYRQITQSIIDENYDPMTIPVLDNNKLIPLKKRERQKDEMTEAIDVEKRILEDLAKAGLNNYKDFNVKLTLEATLDNGTLNIETGSMPKDIKGYETIDLTFIIPNGADAYKAHISVVFEENSDGKGNLKVTMKRINGTWYWNPFGW